jgi:hypothetical protein
MIDDDEDDDFDYLEHNRLNDQIIRETLKTKPADLVQYEIWARESGNSLQLQLSPPFELSDDAVTAVREMFLFMRKSGQAICGMHLTAAQQSNKAWQLAADYEYP